MHVLTTWCQMRLIHGWEKNVYLLVTLVVMLILTKSLNVCHCSPVGKGFYYDIETSYLVSLAVSA